MPPEFQEKPPDYNPFLFQEMSGSGIPMEVAIKCGIYVEHDRLSVAKMLRRGASFREGGFIVFPYFTSEGARTDEVFQIKPQYPLEPSRKYESPSCRPNVAYFPPLLNLTETIYTFGGTLIITEGAKKTIAANHDGVATIGLSGVWNWTKPRPTDKSGRKIGDYELIDDLADVGWEGRNAVIVFDTDPRTNPQVTLATCSLAVVLEQFGAKASILHLPVEYDTTSQTFKKYGIDDFIVAKGIGSFKQFIDDSLQPPPSKISLEEYRNEMRWARKTIRGQSGIYLDRSGTGTGKSHCDILEIQQ